MPETLTTDEILERAKNVLVSAWHAEESSIEELLTHWDHTLPGEALEDHPNITVRDWSTAPEFEDGYTPLRVNALGLINGIVHALTGQVLVLVTDKETGRIDRIVTSAELKNMARQPTGDGAARQETLERFDAEHSKPLTDL